MVDNSNKVGFCESVHEYMSKRVPVWKEQNRTRAYFEQGTRQPVLILEVTNKPVVKINRKDLSLDATVLGLMMENNINPDKAEFSEENGYLIYRLV